MAEDPKVDEPRADEPEGDEPPGDVPPVEDAKKEEDRRDRFRVPVNMKVLVKCGQRSEIGTIQNISRKGLFFTGFGEYQRGMPVQLVYPYDPTKPTTENFQHADVTRVIDMPNSIKKGIGVKLLDIRVKY